MRAGRWKVKVHLHLQRAQSSTSEEVSDVEKQILRRNAGTYAHTHADLDLIAVLSLNLLIVAVFTSCRKKFLTFVSFSGHSNTSTAPR